MRLFPESDYQSKSNRDRFESLRGIIENQPPLVALAYKEGLLFMNFGTRHDFRRIAPLNEGNTLVFGGVGNRGDIKDLHTNGWVNPAMRRLYACLPSNSKEISGRVISDGIADLMRSRFSFVFSGPFIAEIFIAEVGESNNVIYHIQTDGNTCTHDDFLALGARNYCANNPLRLRVVRSAVDSSVGTQIQEAKEKIELCAIEQYLEENPPNPSQSLEEALKLGDVLKEFYVREISGEEDPEKTKMPVSYNILERGKGLFAHSDK